MLPRRNLILLGFALFACAGCHGAEKEPLPPPAVDLIAQADAAAEIVDTAALGAHVAALGSQDPTRYLAAQLQRVGLAPGGRDGSWQQTFEKQYPIAAATAPFVIDRGDAHVSLDGADFVAALGGRWAKVRLHGGVPMVLVPPSLALPPAQLAGKVLVVLDPAPQPGAPPGTSPLPDLFRRAAAVGAHGVLVLPRAGSAGPPPPARAAQLAAGSGIPVAVWLSDGVARETLTRLIATGLDSLPRIEMRADLLPLEIGRLTQLSVDRRLEHEAHRNLVGLLPARPGARGEPAEVVMLLAPLPVHGSQADAAAAAELLGVATAFQALSDPPRRTLVVAFTDPGADGVDGARQLVGDPRWSGHVAGGVGFAGGNLGAPTQEIVFVGGQLSPLEPVVARAAALQGRRVAPDPTPWTGTLWRSPAWALLQAGAPAVLLAPGSTLQPPAAGATTGPATARATPAPQFLGMVEDSRLAFRVALEICEGATPPRVSAQRVLAAMQASPPPVATPTPALVARRPRALATSAATPVPDRLPQPAASAPRPSPSPPRR